MRSFGATEAGEQSLCLLACLVYCNLRKNCRHWYRHCFFSPSVLLFVDSPPCKVIFYNVSSLSQWTQAIQWCYQGLEAVTSPHTIGKK